MTYEPDGPPDGYADGPPDGYADSSSLPTAKVHPSKMTDDEIATGVLGMSPEKWAKAKASGRYRLLSLGGKKQVLADAFTDPEGWWGSYVVGKNKDVPGSSVNRAVQSAAAGGKRGLLGVQQLVGQLTSRLPGQEGSEFLDEALLRANEANQNINQGRSPSVGGFDPMNIAGQGVVGASLSRGGVAGTSGTRLAGNAALGATEAALTTPGGNRERAIAAGVAGTVAPVVSGVSSLIGKGMQKARGKAYRIGGTPAVIESMDDLSKNYGGGDQGEAWHRAAVDKYNTAWGKAHEAYRPVDEFADTVVDIGGPMAAIQEVLQSRGLSPAHPAQEKFFRGIYDLAEKSGGKAKLSDVITVIKDIKRGLHSLRREHGDLIDRDAFEMVENAFKGSIRDTDPVVAEALSNADSVFAREVGPLINNKTLVKLRDKPEFSGDQLRTVARGPQKNIRGQELATTAEGSSPDPIMYQIYEDAINQAGGRPAGFSAAMKKALPAFEAMDPKSAEVLARQIETAESSRAGGALANFLAGKVFGTPASVVGSFNPGISGPGGVWGALQKPGVREWLTKFGSKRTSPHELKDTLRALLLSQTAVPGEGLMQ